jgi:dihydroorotate dehydrogenase
VDRFDTNIYLQSHPDPQRALQIKQQMDEIALMIDKMNAREQSGNRLIVLAATMFLTSSLAYTLYQLSDVNSAFTASIPSIFHYFDFSTARKILATLARFNLLPVDYGSEDPYMIRTVFGGLDHPKTRPLRICVPVGLGAGIETEGTGPGGFMKLGFGSVDVGPITILTSNGREENQIQLLQSSVASALDRLEPSEGLEIIANRLSNYFESRSEDLLTRNTVTGLSIIVNCPEDISHIFSHSRIIQSSDYISLDVSCQRSPDMIAAIIERVDEESVKCESIPLILLKVNLSQSLPPSETVADAMRKSKTVIGVNIDGKGQASVSASELKIFQSTSDVMVSGRIVKDKATVAISKWYKALGTGKLGKEIFASGGVYTGKDALEKIQAGASMINVYSSFIHDGLTVARRIKTQLSVQLMNKGYYTLDEAIGADHRISSKHRKDLMKRRKRF